MNELCNLTAISQRDLINRGEVSAVELLDAHLDHIDRTNGPVNAIVTRADELAHNLARAVDASRARGDAPGLLAGLPIAHKDLVATKGIRTTFGSRIHADFVPDADALIVERLRAAGAVSIGKTNVPEFGAGSQTFNEVFGATRNPYDFSKTCGGSSGGAAVALACRMVPIADGSDMGGSLRNPANFCNVVGFRTSGGRVPSVGGMGWFQMSVLGPMARTVGDTALMLAAIAGPDRRAPASLNEPGASFLAPLQRDFTGTKVSFSTDFGLPVAKAVQDVVASALPVLRDIGCDVVEQCPDFADADYVFKTLRAWAFATGHRAGMATHRELYKDTIQWNVDEGAKLSGQDIATAQEQRTALFLRVSDYMESRPFLILPVSQVPPFDINTPYVKQIEGVQMETYIDWMKSCYYISAIGLPAISVPCGFTDEGLPVGVQIVGRHQHDFEVLQLAHAFEQALPVYEKAPDWIHSD